jgi:hypothetical protein
MDRYIQNRHIAGIHCKTPDGKTDIWFRIQRIDKRTGRLESTGYTRVTEAQYQKLTAESRTFTRCVEQKMLVVYDEPPADALTPHEALITARREAGKLKGELEKAQAENTRLQAELVEANKKYGELLAASGGQTDTVKKPKKETAREFT